jgi:DNA-binding transcriptional LysR family regulator
VIATKQYEISDIEYIQLEEEEFVIVVPPQQVVPSHLDSMEGWLEQQRWISYGKEFPIIRRVWKQHFNKILTMNPFHIIPDLGGILKSIEMGMGMSVLPSYLIHESVLAEKSKVIFPELSVKNQLYLACKTYNRLTPLIQQVVKELVLIQESK